jgi:hypothetical protein
MVTNAGSPVVGWLHFFYLAWSKRGNFLIQAAGGAIETGV